MWKLLNWIDVEQLSWSALSENPKALNLLQDNQNKIVWSYLCRNINVDAIRLLESNLDKINLEDWAFLSRNPAAIHLLEQNIDKIHWPSLSFNSGAIHLIEANIDKINWAALSYNPSAIHLLEKNPRNRPIY